MDDRELLDRCLRRVAGSWEEFLARYRGVIERAATATLSRVLGSAGDDDVQAIVEVVLVGLVKDDHAALRAFAGRSSLAGYLRAIASKLALNHVRGERRKGWLRFRPLEDAPEPAAAGPGRAEDDPSRMAALMRALAGLAPRDRLVIKLFHIDGAGYKEIASLLGVSVNAVSPMLIRARGKLRALLEKER